MFVSVIQSGLAVVGIYLALGVMIGLWLALTALQRLDPTAKGGSLAFRLLMVPGLMLFWPLLLYRLSKGIAVAPDEHNAHRKRSREV